MANQRTYELDPQNDYSSSLRLLGDDSGFVSGARYIRADVLAPKISDEATIPNSSVTPPTWLLRISGGTNDEYQKTLDDFIGLFTDEIVDVSIYNPDGFEVINLTLQRFKNMIVGQGKVINAETGAMPPRIYYDSNAGSGGSIYNLPANFIPKYDQVFYTDIQSDERNYLIFRSSDGQVEGFMDRNDENYENFSIAYYAKNALS